MDDTKLDELIRRRIEVGTAAHGLLRDAADLPTVRPTRVGLGWSAVALVGCLAMAAMALRFASASGPGSHTSATLQTPAGQLTARLDDERLALELAPAEHSPSEVATTTGGRSRPFVAQLVCGPDEPLADLVVLFGFLGTEQPAEVQGLPPGRSSTGADGSFLYVTDAVPAPGTSWTVTSGSTNFVGPVAFWGVRDILPSSTTSSCVVNDPSLQPDKP